MDLVLLHLQCNSKFLAYTEVTGEYICRTGRTLFSACWKETLNAVTLQQSEVPLENHDKKPCDLPWLGFVACVVSYFNVFCYKCHRFCLVNEMQAFPPWKGDITRLPVNGNYTAGAILRVKTLFEYWLVHLGNSLFYYCFMVRESKRIWQGAHIWFLYACAYVLVPAVAMEYNDVTCHGCSRSCAGALVCPNSG